MYVRQQPIEGLVFGFGTTRPVDGNVGAGMHVETLERDMSTLSRQSDDGEKERLVGATSDAVRM